MIKQSGNNGSQSLIDLILAVDDPFEWHQENFKMNRLHYSSIKYMPNCVDKVCQLQEKIGARIYFNPYVHLGGLSLKYGVIKTQHLIDDLINWEALYVAGRLHKPVEFIVNTCDRNESLRSALRFNKESAIRAAILQLPESFDLARLYKTITALSYKGDLRMIFGEDANKVDNIVNNQLDRFNKLYLPMIKLNQTFRDSLQWNESKQTFSQDLSPKTLLRHLRLLPREVRRSIFLIHGKEARTVEADVVLASASRSINCDQIVSRALASIVRRSSTSQTLKGLLTAGFVKSLKYSQRKLLKSLTSRINLT